MTHSNKPQPRGPYFQECQAAAGMSEEARYWEEVLYQEGAKADQYDGWDRGDVDNDGAWENEEADAAAGPAAPAALLPVVALSDDDILF